MTHDLDDVDPADLQRHLEGCGPCREAARRRSALARLHRRDPLGASPGDDALFAAAVARARSPRRYVALGAALAVAAAALLALRVGAPRDPAPATTAARPPASSSPAPAAPGRATVDRTVPNDLAPTATARPTAQAVWVTGTVTLADGSTLVAGDGARAEVVTDGDGRTRVVLARGAVGVTATPTAARRLGVEHDGWGAWVHGTRFTVRARTGGIEVRVREGDVLVRGPGAPDGVHVTAGGHVVATGSAAPRDVARVAVARRRAITEGERLVREGVLALGRGDGAGALARFERYLARWPRGPLAEDALAGVMDARWQAGDRAGAGDAARRYLTRFPDGVARDRALSRSGASGP